MEKRNVLMAVDLGASKYMTSFLTDSGEILYKKRYTWTSHEPEEVVRQIYAAIEEALSTFSDYAVRALGMTIPGLADPRNGIWVNSDSMRIQNLPIARLVSDHFGFPVFIDNDCKACALAEKWFGSCKG